MSVPRPAGYEFLFLSPVFDQEQLNRVPPDRRILFDAQIHPLTTITDGSYFRKLEEAPATAARLQVIWGESGQEGRFKLREAATEELLRRELDAARYVHLATYGFVQGASPEEAGLVLANTDPMRPVHNDGLLLASELSLQPVTGTALLSVDYIQTGRTPGGKAVDILPLSGSLMLHGISHLIFRTRQHGAESFFPLFYEQLLKNASIPASLQEVKRQLAKREETAAPRLWAYYRMWRK
jgi:CHAT domain-containing protein